jgi:hypothetical protein
MASDSWADRRNITAPQARLSETVSCERLIESGLLQVSASAPDQIQREGTQSESGARHQDAPLSCDS